MYHVGEFEQWLDGSNRVLPLTTFGSGIDFIDISMRLYFDTSQPNYTKRPPTIREKELLYIVCGCPFAFDELRRFFLSDRGESFGIIRLRCIEVQSHTQTTALSTIVSSVLP
jgi:hypothetical protein